MGNQGKKLRQKFYTPQDKYLLTKLAKMSREMKPQLGDLFKILKKLAVQKNRIIEKDLINLQKIKRMS